MADAGGLRVSLAMALVALIIVALAENARIPVDNPSTHLEVTMVHEAMVLEYSGRHLAMIESAASLKLLLYISVIACIFFPFGLITGRSWTTGPYGRLGGFRGRSGLTGAPRVVCNPVSISTPPSTGALDSLLPALNVFHDVLSSEPSLPTISGTTATHMAGIIPTLRLIPIPLTTTTRKSSPGETPLSSSRKISIAWKKK